MIFLRPSNIICMNVLVSCRVPLYRSAPEMTILGPFTARVMALRSLHSQLVAQVCAQRKRALQIKGNVRNSPELAKISGEGISCMQGSKCSKSQGILCMQGSECYYFLGLCACRSSTCFTLQGCVHERLQMLLEVLLDFVHARVPRASISRDFGTQGLQMLSRDLVHGRGQDASITGWKCFNCQGLKCPNFPKSFVHHWSTLSASPAWFQKRPFWANFDPDVGDPSFQ